ncbi:MAG: amidohydrolase family protein [Candidatus Cloacimonetes bacterium]|nr:amidohydrolase family protein [Candidatus Cloacimonadota bacterium]
MKLFTNASLPTSSTALKRVNVLFDQKILKISPEPIESEEISQVIDLKGMILLPGGVDAHSHIIREKDPTKSIARVSKAAILGGWTSFAELSYLDPKPITSTEALQAKRKVIEGISHVDMALWGNVDIDDYPYHAEAAQELWGVGAAGIALMNPSPNPQLSALDFTEIMDLFLDIYGSDTAFAFQGFDVDAGADFSFESQSDAIKKLLRRMQENPIHIPRVSSFATVEFINSISKRSDISFSLCIADLMKHFSGIDLGQEVDFESPENQFFMLLRTNKIYMLSNNVESAVPPAGLSPAFWGTPEALLPFSYLWALSELWKKRRISLATVIKMTSENAAKRLGLYPQKGSLAAGSDADFVVYDPAGSTVFKAPDGSEHQLEGSISSVYLRGERVVHNGKAAPATGIFLPRSTNPKRRHNSTTWI